MLVNRTRLDVYKTGTIGLSVPDFALAQRCVSPKNALLSSDGIREEHSVQNRQQQRQQQNICTWVERDVLDHAIEISLRNLQRRTGAFNAARSCIKSV